MVVNEKCDVYNFGIVALEIIMGRHPEELISSLTSSSSQNIIMKDVLDPRLSPRISQSVAQSLVLVVTLALACLYAFQSKISAYNETGVSRISCSQVTVA